uniref:Mediator of RNA polymerase II transcription subunit 14 n=1 Tax=Mesocestoides corti TaxID=53468 RepID=A0A5K3F110_MESCO
MLSEALDFPWRIISVEFLVSDPEKNISGPLIHPRQTRFLVQQAQSRILYQSFDKRPPLVHLYDMLHAFATSLQLDVLYEQAQRLRSRRPTDPFNIECYRPGQLLKVIYWRGLTNCNYQAVMGPDGKMRPAVYSISIHVDPLDPQRPLSLTHHPELSAIDVHKIGSFVRGDCLSIENLLTRTIIIRAEAILMDIKRELLPLSPGPIVTSEIPLCLSVPILWPCYTHELLYLRVDSAQGHLRASFATESIKGPQLLRELEMAFNRPSCRRVNFDHGSATDYRAGTRGMRSLAGDDARWQARLVDIFARLRCLLGQWRISSVHHNRPVRDSLPIAVPTDKSLDLPYTELLERAQQGRVALSYIKLFPNDDHYLVCEITPTPSLSVDYQYYMMKCVSMPVTVTDFHVPSGGRWLTYNPNHVADSSGAVSSPSVVLRITHFLPFNGNVLAPSIKSTFSCRQQQQPPLSALQEGAVQSQHGRMRQRLKRVRVLLDHLPEGASDVKRRCLERLDPRARAMVESFDVSRESQSSDADFEPLPDLLRLLSDLEDDVIASELTFKVGGWSLAGGCISTATSRETDVFFLFRS